MNANNNPSNTNNDATNNYTNRSENNNSERNYEDSSNILSPINHNFNQQLEYISNDVTVLTEVDDRPNSNRSNSDQGHNSYNINMPNVERISPTNSTSRYELNNDGNSQYIPNNRIEELMNDISVNNCSNNNNRDIRNNIGGVDNPTMCNCRKKSHCPLFGFCCTRNVVYRCIISTRTENYIYIGCSINLKQ